MKENKGSLNFELKVNNPKKDAIPYKLETVQDIADAITHENIDKFLSEFEVILRSIVLAKYLNKNENVPITDFVWTDD